MHNFRLILIILLFLITLPVLAGTDYINTPRTIRVGLALLSPTKQVKISSSNGSCEIIDLNAKKCVFNGKFVTISIKPLKDNTLSLSIDGKSLTSSNCISVSNNISKNKSKETLSVTNNNQKSISYRGIIEIQSNSDSLLNIVNVVDMEDYLKSVVPSEISIKAPQAAQEAQAIAARTYAVRNIDRHTKKENFNLCDTVHCQAYFGISKEYDAATKAINSTIGQILIYDNTPANTVYHSNCGGYIISSQAAWGGKAVPYLIGHFDGVKGNKTFCEYGKDYLSKHSTLTLPAKSKRLVIGKIDDYSKKKLFNNFGHRVGMCQDGAIGMSIIGYTCGNILGFYYPKTKIVTLNYAGKKVNDKNHAPTEVIPLAKLKNKDVPKNLTKPILPEEITLDKKIASITSLIAKNNQKEAKKTEKISNTVNDKIENPEIIIKDETYGKIKTVIKEISDVTPNTTSAGIRKVFWRPLEISTTITKTNNKKSKTGRRRKR